MVPASIPETKAPIVIWQNIKIKKILGNIKPILLSEILIFLSLK